MAKRAETLLPLASHCHNEELGPLGTSTRKARQRYLDDFDKALRL